MRFFQGGMDGLEGLGTGFYLSSFFSCTNRAHALHHDSFGWIAIRNGMSNDAFNYTITGFYTCGLSTASCWYMIKKIPCEVAPFLLVMGYGGRFSYF